MHRLLADEAEDVRPEPLVADQRQRLAEPHVPGGQDELFVPGRHDARPDSS
ncbi:hypothetical protein [Amycolatopsis sp. CA-126428]|uniref:hypothetical protein n=1 Tax=Amycolatopsis sp. CA-126428 TaxID=2073158 RepID=UPI001E58CBF0|nr:hypothetical protein [Amycolatopsis sp. CA-126428]